jgi:tetratricopeptide (TPR) repeat protein
MFRALTKSLADERRIVRVEAARSMSRLPSGDFRGEERQVMRRALDEAVAAGNVDNDRAGGHLVQGVLLGNLGAFDEAEAAYRTAIRVEPEAVGPRANLSELLDQRRAAIIQRVQQLAQSQNVQAARDLLAEAGPLEDQANRLRDAELGLLERDGLLLPDNAGLQTRLGFLRHLQGWRKEAERAFEIAHALDPSSPDAIYALAIYYKDSGRPRDALPLAQKLRLMRPQDEQMANLESEVRLLLRAGPLP